MTHVCISVKSANRTDLVVDLFQFLQFGFTSHIFLTVNLILGA